MKSGFRMHISRNEPDKLSWQEIDDEIATTSRALIATVEHLSTNPLWRAQIYFRLATAVLEESHCSCRKCPRDNGRQSSKRR